ncbi:MAG: hypothetical protein M1830_008379 [Pleopsidium flavum]|nr:MAG: hypothetical protein M1830_008379 [Pleopsidium flavum]
MTTLKDSFVDLERHRLRLEENVLKLRQSLQHWQTLEAEYEGLKEEILALGGKATSTDIVAIGHDFGGTLVNEKEVKTLVSDGKIIQRTGEQVVDLVSRRVDYVKQNIKTVEKQIAVVEEKLNTLLVIRQPEVRDEEGLPLTEIREELDEEGNVISSTTTIPGDAAPQVVEALRKAGVTDLPSLPKSENRNGELAEPPYPPSAATVASIPQERLLQETADPTPNGDQRILEDLLALDFKGSKVDDLNGETLKSVKKRVIFANAVPSDVSNGSGIKNEPATSAQASSAVKSLGDTNGNITGSSAITDEQDTNDSPSVIPIDESPDDAALRRQMLQYGLHEVGAVVAELDLDGESESQFSYSDDDPEGDEQYASSTDEEEDAFGRTTERVVDEGYRLKMLELEKKLNVRAMENAGPEPKANPSGNTETVAKQTSDSNGTSAPAAMPQKLIVKKGVRFAEELDISPAPGESSTTTSTCIADSDSMTPVQESIVERATPQMTPSATAPSMPKKTSRFKTARKAAAILQDHDEPTTKSTADPQLTNGPLSGPILERKVSKAASSLPLFAATSIKRNVFTGLIQPTEEHTRLVPEEQLGKTHADSIVERETSQTEADALDPDDFDPALLQQEVATEYHRMRNRMIQREGGFLPREDQEERVPLTEEEGGSAKKMSRFKAARLGSRAYT